MNSKERMFAALTLKRPTEVPVAPCYPALFFEGYTHRYYLEQYRRSMKDRDMVDIDHALDTKRRAEAIYQAYGILQKEYDWVEVFAGPSKQWAASHALEWVDDEPYYLDKLTGERQPVEQEVLSPAAMGYLDRGGSKRDKLDNSSEFPDKQAVDEKLQVVSAEELLDWGVFDLAKQVAEECGDRTFIFSNVPTPFWSTYALLGFTGMMLMMYDRPDVFHHMLERRLEQFNEVIKGFSMAGLHGIWNEDCLSSADLISPRHFEEFVFPYLQEAIQATRSCGLIPIHYHCGNAMPRIERLKDTGAACLALEESKKDWVIEIGDVVEAVGDKMCVLGNIDTIGVVLEGSPAKIEREVARQLAAGAKAGSFIVGTGSPFPLETNPRHVDALVEATRRLSPRYFS